MRTQMNVKEAELIGMPKLKRCVLMGAFKKVKTVKMKDAGKLESVKELKEVMEEVKRREEEEEKKKRAEEERRKEEERKEEAKKKEVEEWAKKTVTVHSVNELTTIDCRVGNIMIASHCFNETELKVLNLSRFVNLRVFEVGDKCFEHVNEVKLIGLNMLERVVIGKNSFTKHTNDWYKNDPNRHFYLKDCEQLRELKMGPYSFMDYSVCEIANVPSLEVIEMGELNEWSFNFYRASLELKSADDGMK